MRAQNGNAPVRHLGYRVCTSRDNGYEPAFVVPPQGEGARAIDIHPAPDAVTASFHAPANIVLLQRQCERLGLGRPAADSFHPYMAMALGSSREHLTHPDAVPDYAAYVREQVAKLNARVMELIVPLMEANRLSFITHTKDLNFYTVPDYTPTLSRQYDRRTQNPYY